MEVGERDRVQERPGVDLDLGGQRGRQPAQDTLDRREGLGDDVDLLQVLAPGGERRSPRVIDDDQYMTSLKTTRTSRSSSANRTLPLAISHPSDRSKSATRRRGGASMAWGRT